MKNLFIPILFVALASTCFSQVNNSRVSLGTEVAFPTGSGSDNVSTGFGGTLRYESEISKHVTWQVYAGYIYFSLDTNFYGTKLSGHESIIPIMGGVKYYPVESFHGFYFGGDVGMSAVAASVTLSGYGTLSDNKNYFTFSPNIGYHFAGFDLTGRFNLINDSNYIGIRAAVTF
jgi:hypothetical protein